MKTFLFTILCLVALGLEAQAATDDPVTQAGREADTASLSAAIGSAMFAFYQVNHHDQLVLVATLRYCGAETLAGEVAARLPDLPTFFVKENPQQLVYDLVNKEAMIHGYDLQSDEEFTLLAEQSLVQGQAYFLGYLKGYQVAMETFFARQGMQPFCSAARNEGETYIRKEALVYQGR